MGSWLCDRLRLNDLLNHEWDCVTKERGLVFRNTLLTSRIFLSCILHFSTSHLAFFISHLAFFYLTSHIFFILHLAFLCRISLQKIFVLVILSRISYVPYRLPYILSVCRARCLAHDRKSSHLLCFYQPWNLANNLCHLALRVRKKRVTVC